MRDRSVLLESSDEALAASSESRRRTVFVGGFPCQDISPSSKTRSGANGSRSGLWFDFIQVIEAHRPGWIVFENHPNLRHKGLDQILMRLTALGYDSEWHCISAGSVGAPHQRERLWIISYTADVDEKERLGFRSFVEQQVLEASERNSADLWLVANRPPPRMADGISVELDERARIGALGNAVVPQIVEIIANGIRSVIA